MSYTRYRASMAIGTIVHTITLMREGASNDANTRELEISGEGYTLERSAPSSLLEPLRSMRLEIPLVAETNYALEHIVTDSRPWYVTLTIGNDLYFSGRIEQDLYEEEYTAPPYVVTLTATCGISRLADQYLPISRLATNQQGECSIKTLIEAGIKATGITLPITYRDLGGVTLDQYYIDPEGYRTSQGYLRNTDKVGDILSRVLSSLSLVLYQDKGSWIVESTTAIPQESIKTVLDTDARPLYGSPTLSTTAPYGSVRINLATNKHESLFRCPPPSFPLPRLTHAAGAIGAYSLPLRSIAVSEGMQSEAPTTEQRANGILAIIKPVEGGSIGITCPITEDPNITAIEVSVELTLPELTGERDNIDIQAVGLLEVGDRPQSYYAANYDLAYYHRSTQNAPTPTAPRARNEYSEWHFGSAFNSNYYKFVGWHKEEYHPVLSSPFARLGYDHPNNYTLQALHDAYQGYMTRKTPWSRIAYSDISDNKMARLSFKTAPLWGSVKHYDKLGRQRYNQPTEQTISHLLFRLPMRWWRVYKDGKEDKFYPFLPQEIRLGRIEVKYQYHEEAKYEEFFVADKGGDYVREGEAISLDLTTKIDKILQPHDLKGMLHDAEGRAIDRLYTLGGKPIDIVTHAARNYFAIHGTTQDLITAEVDNPYPSELNRVHRLATRPGKEYRLIGSTYRPAERIEEVTLAELAQPKEEVRHDW